jgi:hypothetical protein
MCKSSGNPITSSNPVYNRVTEFSSTLIFSFSCILNCFHIGTGPLSVALITKFSNFPPRYVSRPSFISLFFTFFDVCSSNLYIEITDGGSCISYCGVAPKGRSIERPLLINGYASSSGFIGNDCKSTQ